MPENAELQAEIYSLGSYEKCIPNIDEDKELYDWRISMWICKLKALFVQIRSMLSTSCGKDDTVESLDLCPNEAVVVNCASET